MAYYEIIFGSGLYQCHRYIAKTEHPTTDYGALVDALIDYAREKGYGFILTDYEYINDDAIESKDGWQYHVDEFTIGGNYGDALIHHGTFYINEISKKDIGKDEVVEV